VTAATSCPHEQDVLELASLGHWPAFAEPALREHAASCPVCGDLARVAAALADWRDEDRERVRVPGAARIWHEAGRRARAEAARRATRPVLAVELAALAAGMLLATTWGPAVWALAAGFFDDMAPVAWLAQMSRAVPALPGGAAAALGWPAALSTPVVRWSLLTLAAWAVLVPLALSLAGLADRMPRPDNGHSKPAR
jgi:hypothetical protein